MQHVLFTSYETAILRRSQICRTALLITFQKQHLELMLALLCSDSVTSVIPILVYKAPLTIPYFSSQMRRLRPKADIQPCHGVGCAAALLFQPKR